MSQKNKEMFLAQYGTREHISKALDDEDLHVRNATKERMKDFE